ncbi:SRPBCC family protein [Nonomuraea sp. NPDC046570]|uniref:SRPBCC family protein n=1 Tax=Nonomuraea sp. NPDC046570 TaxID=3155255 RepID=UPI0033E7CFA9
MIDIVSEIKAVHREVATRPATDRGDLVAVALRRTYRAAVEDVWEALTDPDRVKRWFVPLSGDLREGGEYALENTGGGQILRCDRPKLLRLTFGDESSIVEVRLTAEGESTVLEFDHTVPLAMAGNVAGALHVGPGWDGGLLALGMYLRGEEIPDPVAMANTVEAQEFFKAAVLEWGALVEAAGDLAPEEVAEAVKATVSHFAPDL